MRMAATETLADDRVFPSTAASGRQDAWAGIRGGTSDDLAATAFTGNE
jgi:hypothetical protein